MIDVHPPGKAISNASEFFLHLFTITIGLLIAVGIEAGVERHEHHELALQARQTMTAEIRHNAGTVAEALADITREQQKNNDTLANLQKVQLNPNDPSADNFNLDLSFNILGFEDTAWRTAQATGALGFMPYAESNRYSDIYDAEQTFLQRQDQLSEDETQTLGAVREFHLGKGKLTEAAANAMARELGIMQGHLFTMKLAARLLQAEQNAFLEGKEPPHHLSGSV